MRISYDEESNAAFVYLTDTIQPGGAPRSVMCDLDLTEGGIILLFSDEGKLVGLEILGARGILPPEVLRTVS